jgi:hypothetical protein
MDLAYPGGHGNRRTIRIGSMAWLSLAGVLLFWLHLAFAICARDCMDGSTMNGESHTPGPFGLN